MMIKMIISLLVHTNHLGCSLAIVSHLQYFTKLQQRVNVIWILVMQVLQQQKAMVQQHAIITQLLHYFTNIWLNKYGRILRIAQLVKR